MRLHIIAIGKGRNSPEQALASSWFHRLPMPGRLLELAPAKGDGAARCDDESQRIIKSLPKGSVLIALDSTGDSIASEDLASLIAQYRNQGVKDAVFAIGGAWGHRPDLLEHAQRIIAFGRMTWPHMLIRAMCAEQLYRAEMILANHPYHHASATG